MDIKTLSESLRYRITKEELKYNNDGARESGIDWVQMIIDKIAPAIIEDHTQALQAQKDEMVEKIESLRRGKEICPDCQEEHRDDHMMVYGYNMALDDLIKLLGEE